jgi:hypothetical protein
VTTNVKKIGGGDGGNVVLKNDGTLWSWGDVYTYLSDLGSKSTSYSTLQKIKSGVKDIEYGEADCLDIRFPTWSGILNDGSMVIWGELTNFNAPNSNGWYESVWSTNFKTITFPSAEDDSNIAADTMLLTSEDVNDSTEAVANYEGLDPDDRYNFYVFENAEGTDDIFAAENLLYITQAVPEADGTLSITYKPYKSYLGAELVLVGGKESIDYTETESEGSDSTEDEPATPSQPSGSSQPSQSSQTSQSSGQTSASQTTQQETYTVTYMADTGVNAKTLTVISVPKGKTIASTGIAEPVAEKKGYTFKGWRQSIYSSKWDYEKDVVNYNITLKPIFEYIYLKGDSFDDGLYQYKITAVGKNAAVTVTGRCLDDYSKKLSYADEGNVDIPDTITQNGVTYKVTAIAPNAFLNQKDIERAKIGKNVATIGKNAFSGCKNLVSLTIGKNVTKIDTAAFNGCISLKKVVIPAKVKTIGKYAFKNCKKLKTLTIGKKVTNIGASAFQGCKSLKKVTIPKGVKTIGAKAFYRCTNLKNVTIKANKMEKLGASCFKSICKNATVKVLKKYASDVKSRCDSTTTVAGVNVF